jgi:outer membrane protein assembly factor BamB
MPFKRSWEYLTDSMILLPPTVNGDKIYQPLQEGRVVCLDRRSGSLLWSTDSGGRVTAPVAVSRSDGPRVVLVASEMLVRDGTSSSGLLRSLDSTTGVALWVRDYPRPFKSPIVTGPGRIYIGSADGALYALSSVDGKVLWKLQTQGEVTASALVTAEAIYFGSDDGALRAVNPQNGAQVWKYQTTGRIVCLPVIDDKHIYFGSGDGCIYSLDLLDGRLRWKSRTGAAVEASPVLAGDKLVVGSMDNFLYVISRSSGDRLWKRRLENRIVFPVIVEGDALMVAPFRGDHVPIFLMSDGRRVNYYRLNRGYEIVASPSFFDGTLVVPTDKGLIAAVTVGPAKSEAPKAAKDQLSGTEQTRKPAPRPLP